VYDPTSRYYSLDTAIYVTADGRQHPYTRRRVLPLGASLPLFTDAVVGQGERLDLLTARTLGVPEAFWRVADANDAMNPFDLTLEPGRHLRVPLPQP
jgi:hypothetical protein